MPKFTRHAVLTVRNVCERIQRRLTQIEPEMSLLYSSSANRYQLYGAAPLPITIELEELLGLWRFIGTRHDYDECLFMRRAYNRRKPVGEQPPVLEEKPLSKRKHFHWISKLEACAREKLAKGVQQPALLDYRGLLDDTKLEAPEAPQGATGEPAELPEPDFDMPDFGGPLTELGSA